MQHSINSLVFEPLTWWHFSVLASLLSALEAMERSENLARLPPVTRLLVDRRGLGESCQCCVATRELEFAL